MNSDRSVAHVVLLILVIGAVFLAAGILKPFSLILFYLVVLYLGVRTAITLTGSDK